MRCGTFISSISLFLELAGSNFSQALNPSKVISHRLFLLNVSVVFVNAEKVDFGVSLVFKAFRYDFYHKLTIFALNFT